MSSTDYRSQCTHRAGLKPFFCHNSLLSPFPPEANMQQVVSHREDKATDTSRA